MRGRPFGAGAVAVLLLASGCSDSDNSRLPTRPDGVTTPAAIDDPCGETTTVRLLAGQTIESGVVIVENDGTELCVRYETSGGWLITETHLDIRLSLADIPQTKAGNPKVGHFAFSHEFNDPVSTDEYCFSLAELGYTTGAELVIAAHASVERWVDGAPVQSETAWGEGPNFRGSNWAMYLGHTVQECTGEGPFESGEFTTHTQGEWGSACLEPGDAGCYLDEHFDCFSDGEVNEILVGCSLEGFNLIVDNLQVLRELLPTFGEPGSLAGSYYNPAVLGDEYESAEAGELVGQVIALTLNVRFDGCDPDFGSSQFLLGDLIVCSPDSPFNGWTVTSVLEEANRVLGGCSSPYTAAQLNSALEAINGNFIPGQPVGSYLCAPDDGGGNE